MGVVDILPALQGGEDVKIVLSGPFGGVIGYLKRDDVMSPMDDALYEVNFYISEDERLCNPCAVKQGMLKGWEDGQSAFKFLDEQSG